MTVTHTQQKLQLGLLLESARVSKYAIDLVKRIQSHDRLELTHLLVIPSKPSRPAPLSPIGLISSVLSTLGFRLIISIERLLILKNKRHRNHCKTFELSVLAPNAVLQSIRQDQVSDLEVPKIDLLISLVTDPPILFLHNSPEVPILSLDYSGDFIQRDGPPGFWEVYFRRDVTDFAVKRLTHIADESQVLLRGRVGTEFYYLLNQASLFEKAHHYLFMIIERWAITGHFLQNEATFPECHLPRYIPEAHQAILYLVKLVGLAGRKVLNKASGRDFQANVAFLRTGWRHSALWRAAVIENPPGRYLADPFLIRRNGSDFCFVEDYDQTARRGRISVYKLDSQDASYVGIALEEGFHLSYPFLFDHNDVLYMCPESSENRDIRIYRCVHFPLDWKLEKIIMADVSAVDSILFERNG
jgi:hypothetical protein